LTVDAAVDPTPPLPFGFTLAMVAVDDVAGVIAFVATEAVAVLVMTVIDVGGFVIIVAVAVAPVVAMVAVTLEANVLLVAVVDAAELTGAVVGVAEAAFVPITVITGAVDEDDIVAVVVFASVTVVVLVVVGGAVLEFSAAWLSAKRTL